MFNRNNFLLMVFVFVLTLLYLYLILPLSFDEVWCYGFSYNISNGLIPYRDFNMIVTPLYCFVVSLFLFFFGRNLFIMSFFNSIMLSFIFLLMYKKISYKAIFIYVFLLCFSALPSYNLFCLLLFFILISLDENDCNYYVYSSLLVSAMFLTKQTVGIFFVIPLLYYNRNRLKSLIIFFIPIIIFFIYLLYNGAFYNFIDYCFLGMFDFSNKNSSLGILSIFEFIFIGISFIFLLKSILRISFVFLF